MTPVNEKFLVADDPISPKVYNELSPGNTAHSSYKVSGAVEIPGFRRELGSERKLPPRALSALLELRHERMHAGKRLLRHLHRRGVRIGRLPLERSRLRDDGRRRECRGGVNGLGQIYAAAFNAAENDLDVQDSFHRPGRLRKILRREWRAALAGLLVKEEQHARLGMRRERELATAAHAALQGPLQTELTSRRRIERGGESRRILRPALHRNGTLPTAGTIAANSCG